MLRHLFWSAAIGPLVAALTMLATTLAALPFLRAGSVSAFPGIEALPAMVTFMVVSAYYFGILPCLACGTINGLVARRLPRSGVLVVAAIVGALVAIGFVTVTSGGRLGSPYELVFWALSGAAASLTPAALASRVAS